MSQTQLASMFIGNPRNVRSEDVQKFSGAYSRYGNVIYFTDGQDDRVLSIATAKDFIMSKKPIHHKSLKNNLETFECKIIGERNYDEHVIKGNRIIIPAEDDQQYIEFTIDDVIDEREYGKGFEIYSTASYLDDLKKARAIEPFSYQGTALQHLGRALDGVNLYNTGVVESNRQITISFENWTNPFEYAKRIAREFELELDFEIYHDGLMIRNRFVNLIDRVGAWRGREITFGKDLKSIKRKESGDIYTALIGLGPEPEEGTRLQVLVENYEALERWGRPKGNPQHLIGVYEPQSEREDMTLSQLRQYTQTELNKRVALVDYEVDFLDLEYILGHDDKKIRFGDTIRIKDTLYTPNLFLEARIFEMKRNVIVPDQKEYVLGDFIEFDPDAVHDIYKYVKRELAKKAGIDLLLNYAEPKKVESGTAPTINEGENPIWVDTSRTPHVSHVANNGEWVKMTPTTPAEVDAYTKSQVDNKAQEEAEAKAAQALADAKAFSRNADNINQGIIDVGAIPLRTSITGARLEWDGVNGLVQYDMLGNPVSWLDLDANAHFANAFLSGRIEAQEGYFGDNLRLVDGKIQIIRPDGAISMDDGMVRQDYSVSSFDPYDMTQGLYDFEGNYNRVTMFGENAGFYRNQAYVVVGKGGYVDQRDTSKGYTVRFTTYEFIHSARYLVIGYRKGVNTTNVRHQTRVYDGSTLLYTEWHDAGGSPSYAPITIDLGTPTYERLRYDLRIGINREDANSLNDMIIFRINRVFLTDFI